MNIEKETMENKSKTYNQKHPGRETLEELYIKQNLSSGKIAKMYNMNSQNVKNVLSKFALKKGIVDNRIEREMSPLEQELLKEIEKKQLSTEEVKLIIKQLQNPKVVRAKYKHDYGGKHLKMGIVSDLHIGNSCFDESLFEKSVKVFKNEKIDVIYCPGDIIEGMSNRDGHFYELKYHGITEQVKAAADLINQYHVKMFGITGNHELWARNKANQGVDAGNYLEKLCKNYTNLGQMEADVDLNGIIMKLYHGQDGSSYAPGYRGMKLIESIEGGKKPNILVAGHTHKYLYMFQRNIHYLEAGTFESQTEFMRGKKLMAHKGFSIIELDFSKGGVESFNLKFYPAYD